MPNADLFTDTVVVNTAYVGIGYGDAIGDARPVILDAMKAVEGVLDEPRPDVLVMEFASAAVNLRARWWSAPPKQADALDARDQVLTAIRAALSTHGIDLPFPTQQILFHDQTEESDGNRTRQRERWPAKPRQVVLGPLGTDPGSRHAGMASDLQSP